MRYIKIGIIVIFICVTAVFTFNWVQGHNNADDTRPVIEVGEDIQQVSVEAGDEDLLKGIVASDDKDGDLTGSIIVESVSKFIDSEEHISNVTYVVEDSDGHVTKKTRKIQFTDYTKPKFYLKQPLYFNVGEDIDVVGAIGAEDCYDGDVSGKVKLLSNSVKTSQAGEYAITAQVTNSLGDTSKLKAVVVIRQNNQLGPQITLKENLVYLNKGDDFDEMSYVDSVEDANGDKIKDAKVSVASSTVKTKKAGSYIVQYVAEDKDGNEGYAYLTVVVED